MNKPDLSVPWVMCTIGDQRVALSVMTVEEMVPMPHVFAPAGFSPMVRGVIQLRGRAMPLLDGRRLMSIRSLEDEHAEVRAILQQRKQDHLEWLDELEAAIKEDRPFRKQQDPTLCGFGRWYASFETRNHLLLSILERFDEPHKEIHALAAKVLQMSRAGNKDQALHTIERTRGTTLSFLVSLFDRASEAVMSASDEIAVVIRGKNKPFALCVDSVETVGMLTMAGTNEELWSTHMASLGMGRDPEGDLLLLLDAQALGGQADDDLDFEAA